MDDYGGGDDFGWGHYFMICGIMLNVGFLTWIIRRLYDIGFFSGL